MTKTAVVVAFGVLSLLALSLGVACTGDGDANTPEAVPSTPTRGEGAQGGEGGAMAAPTDGNYTVETSGSELKVGEAGQVQVLIKPAPGFKINEEYPWKASLTGDAVVNPKEAELGRDKWTLSGKEATLVVPVDVKAAGDGKLAGKVSFSVCNDSACDVIRDKEISWSVAAK